MKNIDVLLIGTPNVDIVSGKYDNFPNPGEEIRVSNIDICLGGGTGITAIGLAKLNLKPFILCSIKKDFFGKFVLDELNKEGVETLIKDSSNDTGITIALDAHKDRRFITFDGSVYDTSLSDVSEKLFINTKHVHLTNFRGIRDYDLYMNFIEKAKSYDISVSLDVGWDDSGLWDKCVLDIAKELDMFFINETEIKHYLRKDTIEECFRYLLNSKINAVVKLGHNGSAFIKDFKITRVSTIKVNAVDSTGAGDSFNAGFIYGYLNKMEIKKCLQIANICGALSVEGYGGYSKFPNLDTVNENLKKYYN